LTLSGQTKVMDGTRAGDVVERQRMKLLQLAMGKLI
jgi:hypothetical protein